MLRHTNATQNGTYFDAYMLRFTHLYCKSNASFTQHIDKLDEKIGLHPAKYR